MQFLFYICVFVFWKNTVCGSNIFLTDIVAFSAPSSEVIAVLGVVWLCYYLETDTFLERSCRDAHRMIAPVCLGLERGFCHFATDSTFPLSVVLGMCK